MKRAMIVLVLCCFSAQVACARQDEHTIRVVQQEGKDFVASDCDVLTRVVHTVAGSNRLQETHSVAQRDSFPRYRSYWSKTSVLAGTFSSTV